MKRTELESCVYYHLKDNNKPNPRKKKIINKIVTLDSFVKNELTNIEKIKTIPHYKKYYYVCENSSELLLTELDENVNYLKTSKNTSVDNSILLKYEDNELIYLKKYLKTCSLSSPKIYIINLINIYEKLLITINQLLNERIVHNFINMDSIYIFEEEAILTNFAFSIDISNSNMNEYIKHFFLKYDPEFIEWPPEFHILSYLITNKLNSLSINNIENIIDNLIENQTILKTFGDDFVSMYKKDSLNYFQKYINQSFEYILNDILQFYGTWDNYALSIMFLRIIININSKNKFIILFLNLLVSNIHLNPLKRQTISFTIKNFNNLLDSLEPKVWNDLLNNLMTSRSS
uniref:Protein kinase domain-containing protein n=1 Tax=viral metagenome TaxID=1070528 RepID=A0A6C0KMP1_9ZZZZ